MMWRVAVPRRRELMKDVGTDTLHRWLQWTLAEAWHKPHRQATVPGNNIGLLLNISHSDLSKQVSAGAHLSRGKTLHSCWLLCGTSGCVMQPATWVRCRCFQYVSWLHIEQNMLPLAFSFKPCVMSISLALGSLYSMTSKWNTFQRKTAKTPMHMMQTKQEHAWRGLTMWMNVS